MVLIFRCVRSSKTLERNLVAQASHFHFRKQWFEMHQQIETETRVAPGSTFQECHSRSLDRSCVTVNILRVFRPEQIKQLLAQFDVNQFDISLYIHSLDIMTELLKQSPIYDSLIPTHFLPILSEPSCMESSQRYSSFRSSNTITKLKVSKCLSEEQIYYSLDLFLKLEYFETSCERDVHLSRLITTLLNNQRGRSPNLRSICLHMANANDTMTRDLIRVINSDTPVRHFLVRRICNQIFVQWRDD